MPTGIRTSFFPAPAGQAVTNSNTLVNITFPIVPGNAAGHLITNTGTNLWKLYILLCFSTGAAGGGQFKLITSTTFSSYVQAWELYISGAPGTLADQQVQTTDTTIANALAVAGSHKLRLEASFRTATPGSIDLQFAQNTANATPITLLSQDCFVDVEQF